MKQNDAQPRWQRRADERPRELLEAALAVFVERGFSAARLEEVAKRAGVTKGTVYLYFSGKEDLFKALVRQTIVPELENAEMLVRNHAGSSRDLLIKLANSLWRGLAETSLSGVFKLVLAEAGNFPELARFYHETVVQRLWSIVGGVLETGMAAGEFRVMPVDLAVRILVAPMQMGVLWKHSFMPLEAQPLDFPDYLALALDIVLQGIDARLAP